MSSLCWPTGPLEFRRRSSSASTNTMDRYMHAVTHPLPCSSPLVSPALAPLHLTRRDAHVERREGDYVDGLPDVRHGAVEHATSLCSRATPFSYLPSARTEFASYALGNEPPPSYGPSPFPYTSQTTRLFPRGDSAIADEGEEYDLESMNIHIRETYFATSAERGRWLSSPVAPRVRSQATPSMRGHSSPIKSFSDGFSLRERVRKLQTSRSFGEQCSIPSSKDRDKDLRCSSPLPPSSPITSPMSNISFLTDHEGDSAVDPRSNSDDCQSLSGTPDLSISSTACTSPVEPARTPTPPETSTSFAAHHPTDTPPRIISRHTIPCSPVPLDVNIHTPGTTDFELDDVLSPLSQFELDLPDAEPPKLPLSDTVNKPHPGQHSGITSVSLTTTQSQDGTPPIQSLSTLEPRDCLGSSEKAKSSRSDNGNTGAKRTSKRTDTRSSSPSSDSRRSGTESRLSNRPEPPCKKSKLSQCRGDAESRGTKSLARRGGMSQIKRSSSRPTVEVGNPESSRARDREIPKSTRAQSRQPASDPSATPIPTHSVDAGFHAALTGMLIEALATSRATSMDAPTLYLVLTQAHPHITNGRPKAEILMDMAAVLESGRNQCGMFQKVDGSGERSRNKALESRWFYVPEHDEDRERASLISAIMPRQKRNETKKYKQYYYRPLDKMTRWDPEDAP